MKKLIAALILTTLWLSTCADTTKSPAVSESGLATIPVKTTIIGLGIMEEYANMDFISLFGTVAGGMQFTYDGGDVTAKAKNTGIPDDERIKAFTEKISKKLPSGLILQSYFFDGQITVPNKPYKTAEGSALIEGRKTTYLPTLVTEALTALYGGKSGIRGTLYLDNLTLTESGEKLFIKAKVLVFEE